MLLPNLQNFKFKACDLSSNRLLLVLLSIFFSLPIGRCQSKFNLKGRVITDQGSGVNSVLLNLKLIKQISTSNLFKLSDTTGHYIFQELDSGEYKLSITHTSFRDTFLIVYLPQDSLLNLVMKSRERVLENVNVKADSRIFEKNGIIRFNYDDILRKSSANLLDAISKAPGIKVSEAGISLFSRSNVLITFNGKRAFVTNDEALRFFLALPSNEIVAIEINPNPSILTEDQYSGGVINIITRKNEQVGLKANFSTNSSIGSLVRFSNSLSFIYSNKKFNSALTYSISSNKMLENKKYLETYTYKNSTVNNLSQDVASTYKPVTHFARYSFEINPSKSISLGLNTNYTKTSGITEYNTTSTYNYKLGSSDSTFNLYETRGAHLAKFTSGIYYIMKLDSIGTLLRLDASYLNSISNSESDFALTKYQLPENFINNTNGSLSYKTNSYSFRAEMSIPSTVGISYKLGYQAIITKYKNHGQYDSIGNSSLIIVYNNNNDDYRESIHSIFFTAAKKIKKWNFDAGVRNDITTVSLIDNFNNLNDSKHHYNGFVPSLNVAYNLNPTNQINFSIRRSLVRPNFSQLSKSIIYINQNLAASGSDSLKQYGIYTFSLNYTFKQKFLFVLRYDYINNFIPQYTYLRDTTNNTSSLVYANIGRSNGFQFTAYLPFSIGKKWTSYNTVNAFKSRSISLDKRYLGFDYANQSLDFTSLNYYKFNSTFFTFINLEASSSFRLNQSFVKPSYSVDIGFRKYLLHSRISLGLTIRDITYSAIRQGVTVYNGVERNFYEKFDSRRFALDFSFQFGKTKVPNEKRNGNGIDEIDSRLKN